MVSAIYYFATTEDQLMLLDHLGERMRVTLHRWWWTVADPIVTCTRDDALRASEVMVASAELGGPIAIRPGDPAMEEFSRAGVFNRINWERMYSNEGKGIVDPNSSPVLFWQPAAVGEEGIIRTSSIGSQADHPAAISEAYDRWVKRTASWARRRGTRVWGLEQDSLRPDLDFQIDVLNSIYALPGALEKLGSGVAGRR